MRSTHLMIAWTADLICLVVRLILSFSSLSPLLLFSPSSSLLGAWILGRGVCLGTLVVAEVNALCKYSVADRRLLVPAVAHVIVMLRNCLVSSENLLFRDWVDIHPYLAPDMMSNTSTLNVHPVRDDAPTIVACMVDQTSLVQFKMLVNLVVSSLIVPVVHSKPASIMDGIRSLKMRRGSTMTMITRIGIIQP